MRSKTLYTVGSHSHRLDRVGLDRHVEISRWAQSAEDRAKSHELSRAKGPRAAETGGGRFLGGRSRAPALNFRAPGISES